MTQTSTRRPIEKAATRDSKANSGLRLVNGRSALHPRLHARVTPAKIATLLSGVDDSLTYDALEREANGGAHLFRACGLKTGDVVAVMMENRIEYLTVYWAAQRAGLYITPISTRLTRDEAAYIIKDSGAAMLITSAAIAPTALELVAGRETLFPNVRAIFALGGDLDGAEDWRANIALQPETAIADERAGCHMVYSSGTTGRPKGVRLPLSDEPPDAQPLRADFGQQYGADEKTIYLSPGPLYHTAPLVFCANVHRLGGTVVIMDHFEPEAFLAAIERYRVTFAQVVPTMFARLLKLPEATRQKFDLCSLRTVVHAAAPCPVPIKQAMMSWLGPIIHEYYGGSEANGSTYITPLEWLQRPGSVGRANWGVLHICDDEGHELPAGEVGLVYFEGGLDFQYHNDPEKTLAARHTRQPTWSTLGDIGFVDADGYLFLTDRKAFMIISGGVNIYPQEAENVLVTHPKVADAAVFGVPSADMGEEVKAVVQPLDKTDAGDALAQDLIAFCRIRLAGYKCPRSVDFVDELPRHANGKLYKKSLRDRYWPTTG
ncbi:MAG: acyl-CoA synthetase [Caulobacteraceae bacterium]